MPISATAQDFFNTLPVMGMAAGALIDKDNRWRGVLIGFLTTELISILYMYSVEGA